MNDIPIESISKLSLAPDDVVVVRTDRLLYPEQRKCLEAFVKLHTPPGNKVLVLDSGLRLEVLSPQAPLTESEVADLARSVERRCTS